MRSTEGGERFKNGIVSGPGVGKNLLSGIVFELCGREQHVLGGDVFVFEVIGFLKSAIEQLIDSLRQRGLSGSAGNPGQLFNLPVNFAQDGLRADADFFEHRRNDAFLVFEQGGENVGRLQLRIAVF